MTALFDPARHEPLSGIAWDEATARAWLTAVASDAARDFSADALWPAHPRDIEDERDIAPFAMLYMGAGGVIWALDELARAGIVAGLPDFGAVLETLLERNRVQVESWGWGTESLLMGQSGLRLLQYRLRPSAAVADIIAQSIARNADHPANELLWGAPGTLHAALAMHELTGEARFATTFRSGLATLRQSFVQDPAAGCRMWTQALYGERCRYVGAGHGFAGNAGVIVRGMALMDAESRQWWTDAIVATATRTASRAAGLANWPALADDPARGSRKMLVQWCHGAPGIVTSLGMLDDARLDEILCAAGELIWTAGPLAKGGGLCHGTAGNGHALLRLHARTGDAHWLQRARAFAMHAMRQSDAHALQHARRRYALWTGDLGIAWFAHACMTADPRLPQLEAEAAPGRRREAQGP